MIGIDHNDPSLRHDEFSSWGRSGFAFFPPAIVQTVEDPWDSLGMDDLSRSEFEIVLDEENADTKVERYLSEHGAVVPIDEHSANPQNGNPLPEKLDALKARLGIGMKHLAAMLGVERPAVYAWSKGERQPQPKRWERIHSMLEMADYWQSLSRHPLSRRIFIPVESGHSAMDLLSAETLDVPRIKEVLKRLAVDENDRSARLRQKATAMRERMSAKGIKPLPDEAVDQSMRNLSGL